MNLGLGRGVYRMGARDCCVRVVANFMQSTDSKDKSSTAAQAYIKGDSCHILHPLSQFFPTSIPHPTPAAGRCRAQPATMRRALVVLSRNLIAHELSSVARPVAVAATRSFATAAVRWGHHHHHLPCPAPQSVHLPCAAALHRKGC